MLLQNKLDKEIMKVFLARLRDDMGTSCCNDFPMAVTNENREEVKALIKLMYEDNDPECYELLCNDVDKMKDGGMIYINDFEMLTIYINRLKASMKD